MDNLNDIFEEIKVEVTNYIDAIYTTESVSNSYIIRDKLYPKIESVLSTNTGDGKFKHLVGRFIDKNSSKLFTSGPVYMIPFGDADKSMFFNIFNVSEHDVAKTVKEVIAGLKTQSDFKLLTNNPIFWVFYCAIRFYTIKKDKKGINAALSIYALSSYPSIFSRFFKYGVHEPTMQYTMDNLSDKYLMKKANHLFGGLNMSIQNSYSFFISNKSLIDGSDAEVIRFIQRIRNDQKSMMYNISVAYMINYNKGNQVTLTKDANSEVQLDVDAENNTTVVEVLTNNITNQILINGLDISRIKMAKSLSNVSLSDLRFYLSKIVSTSYTKELKGFIQSILFLYLYTSHKTKSDINSSSFLVWGSELFRKTNSNDPNINNIKHTLDKWAEDTGVHDKFRRLATRSDYKKAIFWFFIFSIQNYTK